MNQITDASSDSSPTKSDEKIENTFVKQVTHQLYQRGKYYSTLYIMCDIELDVMKMLLQCTALSFKENEIS